MIKPKASDSILPVSNPANISIEFVCKECGNEIKPGLLNCNKCNSALIDGMDPILNWILSKTIYLGIPIIVGLIIGLIIGKVDKGLLGGIIIGSLLATSIKRMGFKGQGIWAMMRMGDSTFLEFFCPTSTWEKGILPILVYLSANTHNLYKFNTQSLNEQELSIVKEIIDAKLKPSEINTSITLEKEQRNQPVNQPEDNSIKIQQINKQEGNSIINITRLPKTRGSFDIFDVYVDDKKELELKNGQTCKIDSYSGDHTIRIQVKGWLFWSDTFSFSLTPGETFNVSCISRFNKGPLIERVSDKKK
ncbi:MAG: hypothetical protein JW702_08230 [Clostridiales bacterium]|nr:hypothetical protein [Clostridiales bacterium]